MSINKKNASKSITGQNINWETKWRINKWKMLMLRNEHEYSS